MKYGKEDLNKLTYIFNPLILHSNIKIRLITINIEKYNKMKKYNCLIKYLNLKCKYNIKIKIIQILFVKSNIILLFK